MVGGAVSLSAASVELDSGDILYGEITSHDDEKVVLEHPDFGPMEIFVERIVALDEGTGEEECCDECEGCEEEACDEDPICVVPWCGKASIGFTDKTGNSFSETLAVDISGTRKTLWNGCPWIKWHGQARYDFEEKNGEDTVNKGQFRVEYERRIAAKWTLRAQEDISFDQKKDLRIRIATTGGVGYYLFDGNPFSLQLTLGLARVDAFYSTSSDNEHDMNLPMGWELSWNFFRDYCLTYEMEFSPDIEDWDRHRIYNDIELSIPISDAWSFNTEYEYIYLSIPPQGKERYDGSLRLKLCYCF